MTDKGCVPSERQGKKSQFDVQLLDSQPCENTERFRVMKHLGSTGWLIDCFLQKNTLPELSGFQEKIKPST